MLYILARGYFNLGAFTLPAPSQLTAGQEDTQLGPNQVGLNFQPRHVVVGSTGTGHDNKSCPVSSSPAAFFSIKSMSHSSVDPRRVDWAITENKRKNDALIRQFLIANIPTKRPFRMLTFPAGQALMEQNLLAAFTGLPVEITGIERNHDIFRALKRTAKHLEETCPKVKFNLQHGPGSFKNYLRNQTVRCDTSDMFDFIYPDYMGTWSREKREDIALIFEKKLLRDGGFLTLTLMTARGRPETIDELQDFIDYDFTAIYQPPERTTKGMQLKSVGVAGLICKMAEDRGIRLEPRIVAFYTSPTLVGSFERDTTEISLTFQKV